MMEESSRGVSESYRAFLSERREEVLAQISEACRRAGRDAAEIDMVAVSKTVGPDEVRAAYEAGWTRFAENRPQELNRKLTALDGCAGMPGASFDMIGNLQTNKINQVLGKVRLIHSVSSLHLAQAISKRAADRGLKAPALLEVNVSGEASKSGFTPDEARESLEAILGLGGLDVRGLMTMAPLGSADEARRTFSGLRELRDELRVRFGLALPTLSCGMSDDFAIAIEEGSTLVRLGRIVFSEGYFDRNSIGTR